MRNVIRTSDARHTGGIGLYGHRGQLPDERFGRGLVFFTVRRPGPDRPDERTVKHGRAPRTPGYIFAPAPIPRGWVERVVATYQERATAAVGGRRAGPSLGGGRGGEAPLLWAFLRAHESVVKGMPWRTGESYDA